MTKILDYIVERIIRELINEEDNSPLWTQFKPVLSQEYTNQQQQLQQPQQQPQPQQPQQPQQQSQQQPHYPPMKGNKVALVGDSYAAGMKPFWRLGDVYGYPGKSWGDSEILNGIKTAVKKGYKNIVVWCGVNEYKKPAAYHAAGVRKFCAAAPNSILWFFQYAKQKSLKSISNHQKYEDPNLEEYIRKNVCVGLRDGANSCKNARFTDLSDIRQYPLEIGPYINGVPKHSGLHLTKEGRQQLARDIESIIRGGG